MRLKRNLLSLALVSASLLALILPTHVLAQDQRVNLSLWLTPGSYYREVIPGEETTFHLEVRNNGDVEITNINISADAPQGWTAKFHPESIVSLHSGSTWTVDVALTAATDADRGDYNLTIIAEADQTREVLSTTLRVEQGLSVWLWVGVGVGVLVLVMFIMLYLRFGREKPRTKSV